MAWRISDPDPRRDAAAVAAPPLLLGHERKTATHAERPLRLVGGSSVPRHPRPPLTEVAQAV